HTRFDCDWSSDVCSSDLLHDCLHNLQFKYARLISSDLKTFTDSPEEADTLAILFLEMADELSRVRPETVGLESQAAEQLWLNVRSEERRVGKEGRTERER